MKYLLMLSIVLALSGCAEKQEFEQVVLEKMKIEKDIKDYKIDPEEMTKCVTSKTAMKMDGIFPAHANYAESIVDCLSGLVTGEEEKVQAVVEQPATKP